MFNSNQQKEKSMEISALNKNKTSRCCVLQVSYPVIPSLQRVPFIKQHKVFLPGQRLPIVVIAHGR